MWCALACTHSAFVVVHCRRYGRAKLFAEEVIRDYAAAQPAFRAAILRCVRAAVCRTYALPPNGAGGERTAGRAGPTGRGPEGRLLGHSQRGKSAVGCCAVQVFQRDRRRRLARSGRNAPAAHVAARTPRAVSDAPSCRSHRVVHRASALSSPPRSAAPLPPPSALHAQKRLQYARASLAFAPPCSVRAPRKHPTRPPRPCWRGTGASRSGLRSPSPPPRAVRLVLVLPSPATAR